jgi:hypothetical protein
VAAAAFILIFAATSALSGKYPVVDAVFSAVSAGILIFVLKRFGLFCVIVLATTDDVLFTFVHSIQLSQWYAAPTILGVLVVLALAFYGFRVSLAGRPVFAGSALDE